MTMNNLAYQPIPAPADDATDFQRRVYGILGLTIDALGMQQTTELMLKAVAEGRRNFFATPNLNILMATQHDVEFRDSVLSADLSLADGMPIVWIARLLGMPITERIAGSTLFDRLRAQTRLPLKVYFFGGPDGVARRAGEVLNSELGSMRCVGAQSPGFGSIEDMSTPAIIAEINAAAPDILVVALGARRGQLWIEHNIKVLRPSLVSHLGAVINFVAGTVERAPGLVGRLGLEWLWRIKEEPALWRRYWKDGVALLRLLTLRVLPGALHAARQRGARERVAPELRVSQDGEHSRISLAGDWLEADLPPLRQALTALTAHNSHIMLDMARAGRVDGAFVGLLMLLYGHQSKVRMGFGITACSANAARTLRLSCADYLLDTQLAAMPVAARPDLQK